MIRTDAECSVLGFAELVGVPRRSSLYTCLCEVGSLLLWLV